MFFIDASLLLDTYDPRATRHATAREWLEAPARSLLDSPPSVQRLGVQPRRLGSVGCNAGLGGQPSHFKDLLRETPEERHIGRRPIVARQRRAERIAATSLRNTQTALGAFYRRIAYRRGAAKAVTATARKLAVYIYTALKNRSPHSDPGADAYEMRYRDRILRSLERRAANLGYSLVPVTAADCPAPS